MSDLRVRLFKPEDTKGLMALIQDFHDAVRPPFTVAKTWERLRGVYGWVWVAERDGQLVGYAWLTPAGSDTIFLEQVFALHGLAAVMWAEIVPQLLNMGYLRMETIVIRDGWRHMLEQWGFVVTGVQMSRTLAPRPLKEAPILDAD